jgi:DNA repair exonuclease SbcCD nuclease subunit
MRIAILGDTHFDIGNGDLYYMQYQKQFFDDVFFPTLIKNKIYHIIQTGDLFDRPKGASYESVMSVQSFFFEKIVEYGMKCVILCGNHDSTYKNTNRVNAIRSIVPDNEHFVVVDNEPIEWGSFAIVPWINQTNHDSMMKFLNETEKKYCVGHFEFNDFPLYKGRNATHGLNHTEIFDKFKTVFSGHYHEPSTKDNVRYVGTPYELTWADYGCSRGFEVLDTETGKIARIENPNKVHVSLDYHEDEKNEIGEIAGKKVRIIIKKRTNMKTFNKYMDAVAKANPHTVNTIDKTVFVKTEVVTETEDGEEQTPAPTVVDSDIDTIMSNFVQKMDTDFDKEKIMNELNRLKTVAETTPQ